MKRNDILPNFVQSKEVKLFFLGFYTLLLELILIRYLASNIWNLGYFPNLVLMAVFIGMGIGFIFHHYVSPEASTWLYYGSTYCLLSLIIFVHIFHPVIPGFTQSNASIGGELFFTCTPVNSKSESYIQFLLWFISVAAIFTMISQRTAKLFTCFKPLKAYTLDIAGSCCGILCFILLSWAVTPAYLWFVILIPVFIITVEETYAKLSPFSYIPLIIAVFIVSFQDTMLITGDYNQDYHEVKWSPYQRVDYVSIKNGFKTIMVNGIRHQSLAEVPIKSNDFRAIPYNERVSGKGLKPYKKVLIIGSGTGNDVTFALMNGADEVDAVEIDPVIANFGKKFHPAQPYKDKKVKLIIDDGRSFITKTTKKYDLIIYALTDSLVRASPMAQLRLENYLFTEQSVKRAYNLLTENGDLIFYNFYRQPWLVDKIHKLAFTASGKMPYIIKRDNFAIIRVRHTEETEALIDNTSDEIDIPTDDWPFLYLKKHGIPNFYVKAMVSLTLFVAFLMLVLHLSSRQKNNNDTNSLLTKIAFLLMGSAFLLLETKSIIQFSLLFGTTWINSSLVFLSVLLLVLAANWTANIIDWKYFYPIAFILLLASCLITFIYPLSNLLYYDQRIVRFILASLITFSPIYFANLIFSINFKSQTFAEHIFGWNLLGATLGGIGEYFSMAYGYNFLTLVVTICYIAVFILLGIVELNPKETVGNVK